MYLSIVAEAFWSIVINRVSPGWVSLFERSVILQVRQEPE